jgi:hypothetical protein
LRQVFYRLVAAFGYEKTEQAYARLGEMLNRARRSGEIPFPSIRDDGVTAVWPMRFASREEFWAMVEEEIEDIQFDRQEGQEQVLEVSVEAAGMVPLVATAVQKYGVPVFSSSCFDSLTAKYNAACRFLDREVPTVVLHAGDYDPSGIALFEALVDVTAIYEDLGGDESPEFVRVAVTPEQITRYRLPTAPPKAKDKRSVFTDTVTVQS